MNDTTLTQIAQDLAVDDLPVEAQERIIAKFADSFMSRASVEIASNMTPEYAEKLAGTITAEEKVAVIEAAYNQSFVEINEALYEELVAEFKDLMGSN